jgi:hypothetical protein
MKYIITESKLEESILKWLDKKFNLNNLEKVYSDRAPDSVFYKNNGKIILEVYKNFKVYVNYYEIWEIMETMFKLEYEEIQDILKIWLSTTLGLNNFIPRFTGELRLNFWNTI